MKVRARVTGRQYSLRLYTAAQRQLSPGSVDTAALLGSFLGADLGLWPRRDEAGKTE